MRQPFFVSGLHNILFAVGIAGCFICLEGLYYELFFSYEIHILAEELICQQPLNNRCEYQYLVKDMNGATRKIVFRGYTFTSTDITVGNDIKKEKFSFKYEVNGARKSWEFASHYLYIGFMSLCAFIFWRYLRLKRGKAIVG